MENWRNGLGIIYFVAIVCDLLRGNVTNLTSHNTTIDV